MDQLELLFEVAETSWDGLWFVDFDGEIRYSNFEAGQIFGTDRLTGPMADWLSPELRRGFAKHLADVRIGGAPRSSGTLTLLREDRTKVQAHVTESVYVSSKGERAGVLLRIADARRTEAIWLAHRVGQVQLTYNQLSSRAGFWEWDLMGDTVEVTEDLAEHLNWSHRATPATSSDFLALCHEDDREGVRDAVTRGLRSKDRHLSFTARMASAAGWRWVCGRADGVADASGQVTGFKGSLIDVEDTIATELSLKDQASQTSLMHTVSVAANGAATLADLVRLSRDLILIHDDWNRGMVFLVKDSGLEPMYTDESQLLEDQAHPERVLHDRALAEEVLATGELRWDEERLTISLPINYAGKIHAVLTATSAPPLYRHQMIEEFARHMVMQAERVVEREQVALKLAAARDEAMAASHDKSKFLAMMSHEIRTPLNGLIGLNQLLLRTDLDARQRSLAEGAETSGQDLMTLINDALDLSKAQAGRLSLDDTVFDVRTLVSNVVTPAQEGARAKGVTLKVIYGEKLPPRLRGDPIRLTQVIGNLVGNALKFTTDGTITVVMGGQPDGDHWLLRGQVSDTGVGIDPSVGHLFEPFQQADLSTSRRFGGTGLGLAICREIVDAMDGEIGYDSVPAEGSTFHFAVPVGIAQPSDARVNEVVPAPGAVRAGRVLVVEDHPISQQVARGLLEALGQRVWVVGDGESALAFVASEQPDLVFMDFHLPGMDGCQVTQAIREAEGTRRTPVIGMSASSTPEELERLRDCDMDDFVPKPVDLTALSDALERWLPGSPAAEVSVAGARGVFSSTELDTARLGTLRTMLAADPRRLVETLQDFLDGRGEDFDALDQAVRAGLVQPWQIAAHRLAGGAGSIGAHRVARMAQALERGAEELPRDEALLRLGQLDEALTAACGEIDRYLAHLRDLEG